MHCIYKLPQKYDKNPNKDIYNNDYFRTFWPKITLTISFNNDNNNND